MKILINYSDCSFLRQQQFNSKTGKKYGGFDKIISFSPEDIDSDFRKKNESILVSKRGAGSWLWKPYFIYKTLMDMKLDDYLFYCDSGAYFVKSIDHLISFAEAKQETILAFEQPLLVCQYSNKKVLDLYCSDYNAIFDNQVLAGYILIKNSERTKEVIKEWLDLCQEKDLLMDNRGNEKFGFISHREDQSILNLVLWRYNIKKYRDISQYGNLPAKYLKYGVAVRGFSYAKFLNYGSDYPTILHLYRKGKLYSYFPRLFFKCKLRMEMFLSKLLLGF